MSWEEGRRGWKEASGSEALPSLLSPGPPQVLPYSTLESCTWGQAEVSRLPCDPLLPTLLGRCWEDVPAHLVYRTAPL